MGPKSECNITIFLYYVQYLLMIYYFWFSINLNYKNMLEKLNFIVLLFFISFITIAQEKTVIDNNPNYKFQSEKNVSSQTTVPAFQGYWSFGGNIGLAFWNGGTDILIAPKAYYHVTPMFLTGFGITYIYSDFDDNFFGYHSNSIGGSILAAIRPVPYLQFSAEYEGLNTNRGGYLPGNYWNNAIYLGASFVSGNVSFGFRYDVLYDSNQSVYGSAFNPIIGFYF
jgi:hypothetical protein